MTNILPWREQSLRFFHLGSSFILFEKTGNFYYIFKTFFSKFSKTNTRTYRKNLRNSFLHWDLKLLSELSPAKKCKKKIIFSNPRLIFRSILLPILHLLLSLGSFITCLVINASYIYIYIYKYLQQVNRYH